MIILRTNTTEGRIFGQGWEIGYQTDLSFHDESFLEKYEDILNVYFDDGNKNPSVKMNAATMLEKLKQQFPNNFSLPGKTEIKKYTSKLVGQN